MRRTLRPGPKPFIVIAILFAVVASIPAAPSIVGGHALDWLKGVACLAALLGAIGLGLTFTSVTVDEEAITYKSPLDPLAAGQVRLAEIAASIPFVLAEPEHPVSLSIYVEGTEAPVLEIRLKAFRRQDVSWLLSLPALRVQTQA